MAASPVLFIGHGNPMNTLESNRYTEAWRRVGLTLPKPRAVLMISAHWFFGATAVTAMPRLAQFTTSTAFRRRCSTSITLRQVRPILRKKWPKW